MKKLVLTVASLVMIASTPVMATTVNQEVQTETPQEDSFKEIPVTEIPEPIVSFVLEHYQGTKITKAFKDEKGQHKIIVSAEEKEDTTLLFDAKGLLVE